MNPYTCRNETRMFNVVTKPKNTERYKNGFTPRLNENEFKRKLNGGFVFVCDMGDIFSPMVKDEWV